jgi:hypothetical protein
MNVGLTNKVISAFVRAPGPAGGLYAATDAGLFVLSTEPEAQAPVRRPGGRRHSLRVVRTR